MPTRGWHGEIRLSECQDNQTLIAALCRLWASRPAGAEYDQPYFIGVQLNGLVPDRLHSLNLFDALDDEQSRTSCSPPWTSSTKIRHEHPRPRHHAHRLTKPRPRASPSTASPTCSDHHFELFPSIRVTLCIPASASLRIRE